MGKLTGLLMFMTGGLMVALGVVVGVWAHVQWQGAALRAEAAAAEADDEDDGSEVVQFAVPATDDDYEYAAEDAERMANPTRENVTKFRSAAVANQEKNVLRQVEHAKADGWFDSFAEKFAEADEGRKPFVTIYTHRGCSHCRRLEAALKDGKFDEWRAKNGVVMCKSRAVAGDNSMQSAGDWVKAGPEKLRNLPFVRVYWKKDDGTVIDRNFTGRRGEIPAPKDEDDLVDLAISAFDAILFPGQG